VVIATDITPPDSSFGNSAVDDTIIEIFNCLVQVAVDTRGTDDVNTVSFGILVRPVGIDRNPMTSEESYPAVAIGTHRIVDDISSGDIRVRNPYPVGVAACLVIDNIDMRSIIDAD